MWLVIIFAFLGMSISWGSPTIQNCGPDAVVSNNSTDAQGQIANVTLSTCQLTFSTPAQTNHVLVDTGEDDIMPITRYNKVDFFFYTLRNQTINYKVWQNVNGTLKPM